MESHRLLGTAEAVAEKRGLKGDVAGTGGRGYCPHVSLSALAASQ